MEFDKVQRQAVERAKSGSILKGGTGSGKSRTALVYFFIKECNGIIDFKDEFADVHPLRQEQKPLYIITTATKRDKHEWEKELMPFQLIATIDSWNNIAKYTEINNAFFIFDEQGASGSGKWSKSFIKIAKKNHWLLLSATPGDKPENYIPVFIANGFYKNRTEFYTRHVIWSRYTTYPKIDRYINTDLIDKYRSMIQIEMPVKRHTVPHVIFEAVDYDKEKYKKVVKERWNIFEDKPIENAPQYMSVIRRIVNSDFSRVKRLRELIKSHRKTIIFYTFDYEREIILNLARMMEIDVAEWNGHKHEPIPEKEWWIYLVQYSSGSEGWECVQTDTIIFYSLSYSYRMTKQAEGRIDRRNTNFTNLYYYFLISNSPLDVSIKESLNNKKDFNELIYYEKTQKTA